MHALLSKFINYSQFLVLDSRKEFLKAENFPRNLFILVKRSPHCWHWVYCFRRNLLSHRWQLFDSLGQHKPTIDTVAKMLNVKADAITVNKEAMQCSQSDQCGGFCAYLAYQQRIIKYHSIHSIMRQEFSFSNRSNNERVVKAFVTCLRRRCTALPCKRWNGKSSSARNILMFAFAKAAAC